MKITQKEKAFSMAIIGVCTIGTASLGAGYVSGSESIKSKAKDVLITQRDQLYDKDKVISTLEQYVNELDGRVQPQQIIEIDKKQVHCMALNNFNEAGNYKKRENRKKYDWELIARDMFLINSSVLNRAEEANQTPCKIVYQKIKGKAQFSWTVQRNFAKTPRSAEQKNGDKWVIAYETAKRMLSGQTKKISAVKWYNNPKASSNSWHLDQVNKNNFSPFWTITDGNIQHVYYTQIGKQNEMMAYVSEFLNKRINE